MERGYILLEYLLGGIIIMLLAAFLYAGSGALLENYHQVQLRQAAQMLAADIRFLQQRVMFSDKALTQRLRPLSGGDGYILTLEEEDVKKLFADAGCDGVYFYRKMGYVQFTNTGAPSVNGSFELRHKLSGGAYLVAVQPVTGRVVVSEK